MSRCALCNAETAGAELLCAYHPSGEADWAALNRTFCDFLHRGIVPAYVPALEDTSLLGQLDILADEEVLASA